VSISMATNYRTRSNGRDTRIGRADTRTDVVAPCLVVRVRVRRGLLWICGYEISLYVFAASPLLLALVGEVSVVAKRCPVFCSCQSSFVVFHPLYISVLSLPIFPCHSVSANHPREACRYKYRMCTLSTLTLFFSSRRRHKAELFFLTPVKFHQPESQHPVRLLAHSTIHIKQHQQTLFPSLALNPKHRRRNKKINIARTKNKKA
jgi:hypothetical protein